MNSPNNRLKFLLEIVVAAAAIVSLIIFCSEAALWPLSRKLMLVFGAIAIVAVVFLLADRKPPFSTGYVFLMLLLLSAGVILIGYAFQWFADTNPSPTYNTPEPTRVVYSDPPTISTSSVTKAPVNSTTTTTDPNAQALSIFSRGKAYYDQGNFNSAFPYLLEAAQYGLADAELYVGFCYYDGTGVDKDESQAVFWLTRAADQGIAKAQYLVGYCYISAIGTPRNDNLAFTYFKKAADQNESKGLLWTGYCYQNGRGTGVDYQLALSYYEKARDCGNKDAQARINELLQLM